MSTGYAGILEDALYAGGARRVQLRCERFGSFFVTFMGSIETLVPDTNE